MQATRRFLGALLCALVATAAFGVVVAGPASAADPGSEGSFVARINGLRASRGLPPLTVHAELTGVARGWSDHMAADQGLSHNPSLGSQVSAPWRKLGENVARGGDVDSVWSALVSSPVHYANMVDPDYGYIGVGVTWGDDGLLYTTHDFMAMDSPPPPPPPAADPAPAPAPAPEASAPAPSAPATVHTATPGGGVVTTAAPGLAAPAPEPEPTSASAEPERVRAVLAALRTMDR